MNTACVARVSEFFSWWHISQQETILCRNYVNKN